VRGINPAPSKLQGLEVLALCALLLPQAAAGVAVMSGQQRSLGGTQGPLLLLLLLMAVPACCHLPASPQAPSSPPVAADGHSHWPIHTSEMGHHGASL